MSRAACAPENNPPIDLVEITASSTDIDVRNGRLLCAACPVLVSCRQTVLRLDVAGMAGGMTEAERAEWRTRHHVQVESTDIVDVTPARELTADVLDELPPAPGWVEDPNAPGWLRWWTGSTWAKHLRRNTGTTPPDPVGAVRDGELHPKVRDLVIRMTEAHLSAEDIVTRLCRSDVTDRTVNYVRRTYMKGWARVDA